MTRSTMIRLIATVLPLAWMAFIFWLSSQPSPRFSDSALIDTTAKKVGHLGLYAILAVQLEIALRVAWPWSVRRSSLIALGVAAGFAASDEIHQMFTFSRHPSP